jgi:hypothetical protein
MARAEQRRAQGGFAGDVGMFSTRLHGDADKGAREVDRAVSHDAPLRREIVEPFTGEDDQIGGLAPRNRASRPSVGAKSASIRVPLSAS